MKTEMQHIGYIETDFKEKFGIPRQSGRCGAVGVIRFYPEYRTSEAIRGIEGFSHLWILFDFSLSHTDSFSPTVRPPRLGGNTRMGVFATRSPFRPNPIGLSSVKLEEVRHTDEGDVLVVSGVDILDGTPIFDIKPYVPSSDCHPDAVGGFSGGLTDYSLEVRDPDGRLCVVDEEKRQVLLKCLADDPRPSYHDDPEREYGMTFSDYDVRFKVKNGTLYIIGVNKK